MLTPDVLRFGLAFCHAILNWLQAPQGSDRDQDQQFDHTRFHPSLVGCCTLCPQCDGAQFSSSMEMGEEAQAETNMAFSLFRQVASRDDIHIVSVARTLSDVGWPGVIAGKVPTGLPESVARLGQAQRPPGGRLCPRRSGAGRAHNDFRCQRVSRLKPRVDERTGDAGRPRAEA